ncbi:rhodanese family protein [Cellvibrio polysaccharolyticus]|uniref:DUF2892 domain-containing protein n=1 Tax=Cellvibrio polysaccharolyticus TaxID=2082724 RepID=A0A928V5T8_9GAMM|nr:rhodanese family protein [Cellvibrio polysaccharolyticus]MBE8717167.1 DUF2892 domain-containing protein [Cellvibrio polysaccharolyticus]
MAVIDVKPLTAQQWLAEGALLVDIREPDEYAREHIANARSAPLSRWQPDQLPEAATRKIIFHCKSGQRTRQNAAHLASGISSDVYLLEGGLDAWKQAGLPTRKVAGQPLELMRQVQIIAGSLTLLGVLLGFTLSPAFFWLSGFVGAGLLFAGISGFCGMARLLMLMPWNRPK